MPLQDTASSEVARVLLDHKGVDPGKGGVSYPIPFDHSQSLHFEYPQGQHTTASNVLCNNENPKFQSFYRAGACSTLEWEHTRCPKGGTVQNRGFRGLRYFTPFHLFQQACWHKNNIHQPSASFPAVVFTGKVLTAWYPNHKLPTNKMFSCGMLLLS